MPSIEITAKSLDEAMTIATEKLGVPADAVTLTVVEETKGLFGKKNLKIKAETADAAPAAPAKQAKSKAEPKATVKKEEEAAPVVEEKTAKKPARGKKVAKEEAPAEKAPEATTETAATEAPEVVATAEDAKRILEIATNVITSSGLDAEVQLANHDGKYVNLTLDGKEAGYLVGKSGEVLNQIQYLLNVICAQQLRNGVRVTLDGNDYRRNREEQLTLLANQIAEQVAKRGEEAVLDALPAFERRIIHKALTENKLVSTYSEGEEPNRRVVIAPAD